MVLAQFTKGVVLLRAPMGFLVPLPLDSIAFIFQQHIVNANRQITCDPSYSSAHLFRGTVGPECVFYLLSGGLIATFESVLCDQFFLLGGANPAGV